MSQGGLSVSPSDILKNNQAWTQGYIVNNSNYNWQESSAWITPWSTPPVHTTYTKHNSMHVNIPKSSQQSIVLSEFEFSGKFNPSVELQYGGKRSVQVIQVSVYGTHYNSCVSIPSTHRWTCYLEIKVHMHIWKI